MGQRIKFVGREEPLAFIDRLVNETRLSLQVVCIDGHGGIGKTSLLSEVYLRCRDRSDRQITSVIDLSDLSLHRPFALHNRLIEDLDSSRQAFKTYWEKLSNLSRLEAAGAGADSIGEWSKTIEQAFLDDYTRLSTAQGVLLLLDTVEAVQESREFWKDGFLKTLLKMQNTNTVALLAGRRATELYAELVPNLHESIHSITLGGFSDQEADQYFNTLETEHIIEPSLRQKITFLGGGRPIIIDLAVDWLEREFPLPEIESYSVAELERIPTAKLDEIRYNFEAAMVQPILNLTNRLDRVILDMAFIGERGGEMGPNMLAALQRISEDKATQILQEASRLSFVKPRPQGACTLQDEMRRLVNTYVWPLYDPFEDQRFELGVKIVNYYTAQIESIRQAISEASQKKKKAVQERQGQEAEEYAQQEASLVKQYWHNKLIRLRMALVTSLSLGWELLKGTNEKDGDFNEAEAENRWHDMNMLLHEITPFLDKLSAPDDLYFVKVMQARLYIHAGKLEEAQAMLLALLARYANNEKRTVDIFSYLAYCSEQQGNLEDAIKYALQEIQIRETHQLPGLARVNSYIGLQYHKLDQWHKAIRFYRLSLEHIKAEDDLSQMAKTLNRLGYLYGQLVGKGQAISLCLQALAIKKILGNKFEEAITYFELGRLHREQYAFDHATRYFELAKEIFERNLPYTAKQLVDTHNALGIMLGHQQKAEDACNEFDSARRLAKEYEFRGFEETSAIALTNKAVILMEANRWVQAEEIWNEVILLAEKARSHRMLINAFEEGMVVICCNRGDVKKARKWMQKAEEVRQKSGVRRRPIQPYMAIGRALAQQGNFTGAQAAFEEAIKVCIQLRTDKPLPHFGHFSTHTLFVEPLAATMSLVPPAMAIQWCDRLIEICQEGSGQEFANDYPEVIHSLHVERAKAAIRVKGGG